MSYIIKDKTMIVSGDLDQLRDYLMNYTLDPVFERFGNFVGTWEPAVLLPTDERNSFTGCRHYFGNFHDVSGVFNIVTKDAELIEELDTLFKQHLASPKYQRAAERVLKDAYVARLSDGSEEVVTQQEAHYIRNKGWSTSTTSRHVRLKDAQIVRPRFAHKEAA